jgi:hypothetical protein
MRIACRRPAVVSSTLQFTSTSSPTAWATCVATFGSAGQPAGTAIATAMLPLNRRTAMPVVAGIDDRFAGRQT